MKSDATPRLALNLQLDAKNRITWKQPLRKKAPNADAFRVIWNDEDGRYEVYPIES